MPSSSRIFQQARWPEAETMAMSLRSRASLSVRGGQTVELEVYVRPIEIPALQNSTRNLTLKPLTGLLSGPTLFLVQSRTFQADRAVTSTQNGPRRPGTRSIESRALRDVFFGCKHAANSCPIQGGNNTWSIIANWIRSIRHVRAN